MPSFVKRVISAMRERRLISGIRARMRRRYLRKCHGVIHVGANIGQERHEYASRGLRVIWVEPIPTNFAELEHNIRAYPNQMALKALVTDEDGRQTPLHVSNLNGVLSSVLALNEIVDIWPVAAYTHDINLISTRLPTLLAGHDLDKYDALVLDTQGSELMVLRGASEMLHRFSYIECEAATFEAYRNCASVDDIAAFLKEHGFKMIRKDLMASHPSVGAYYDLLFRRL